MITLRTVCSGSVWALTMLLVVGVSTSGAGQGTGSISGTIADESGGVLPGVTVIVTNAGGAVRSGVTDSRGRYDISSLPAGRYTVSGALPGFTSDTISVSVGGGSTATADLIRAIAPLAETVTVTRTDQDLADVLTYARQSWSNDAAPVGAATAKAIRAATSGRGTFWTAKELK